MWKSMDELPSALREEIVRIYGKGNETSSEEIFKHWYCLEEQTSIFEKFGRRQYFVNCWHAASHESVAMWKIYATPGAGVSIVTNGARLDHALASIPDRLHLGAVRYLEPGMLQIGTRNVFDTVLAKRASYEYEREVRLVYWDTDDMHDPLAADNWNDETLRFDDIIEDPRPLTPGRFLDIDVGVLIERVIVSPFAPSWYTPMICSLRDKLQYEFPVHASRLITPPQLLP
jgi:hypothetical protein